jgi:hypothetical protein
VAKQAPGGENKSSEKGEARVHPSAGSKTIKSEEHVGTSSGHHGNMGRGIRFPVPAHPDYSDLHSPEK